jgi:hypothetical protein
MKMVVVSSLTLLVLIVAAPKVLAQAPSPAAPMAGQVPAPDSGEPPPVPPASPSITGTVKQYLLTPVGDVEGIELQDGTDVRFPPHMGAALATIVKPGDHVNVLGFIAATTAYGRAVKARSS